MERSEFFEMQIISGETQTSRKSWIAKLIGSKSLLEIFKIKLARVAEVVRRHEGPSPKSLDLEENFKP